jgi:hypothetical protein
MRKTRPFIVSYTLLQYESLTIYIVIQIRQSLNKIRINDKKKIKKNKDKDK